MHFCGGEEASVWGRSYQNTVLTSTQGGTQVLTWTMNKTGNMNLPEYSVCRPLASKRVLVYLAMYLAFFRILGFSLTSSLLLLLVLTFLVIFTISTVNVLKGGNKGLSLLDTSDIQDLDSGIKKNK